VAVSGLPRRPLAILVASSALLWGGLGWLRFHTVHNETFDLAFYTRMAWGLARFEFWDPIVDAHVFGLHVSPVLVPLGLFGYVPGALPPVLIAAQAVALALAAVPLARFAHRRLGGAGALTTAAVWWLHPTPGHVGAYEVHPGTMAVLPLAWAIDAADRADRRGLVLAGLGVLLCREDLGLTLAAIALVGGLGRPTLRPTAWAVGGLGLAWVVGFALVLHPLLGPKVGSMQLHFGDWGDSAAEVAGHLLTHPGDLAGHLGAPRRLAYPLALLAPLAFLPLARPVWLLAAAPAVAVNLASSYPTTLDLDVHYLVPALPGLVAAAVDGAAAAARRVGRAATLTALLLAVAGAQVLAGGTPLSPGFDAAAYRVDARTHAARLALAAVPPDASVQAADELLPHLAERRWVHRLPPPERGVDVVVFRGDHRLRFAESESVLRTEQEPHLRAWLGRDDHTLVAAPMPYLVLARGVPKERAVGRGLLLGTTARPGDGVRLTDGLVLSRAALTDPALGTGGGAVVLDLAAGRPLPTDLALRLGTGYRPPRVDLLFGGLLSPASLEEGWLVRSVHPLTPAERRRIRADGLRVGLVRESGARPAPGDPTAVTLPLGPDGVYRWPEPFVDGPPRPVPRAPSAVPNTP